MTFNARSPLRIQAGQRVYIECIADGSPPPTLYWRYPTGRRPADPISGQPGVSGPPARGSAILNIASISKQDEGVYYCVAENRAGQSEQRFEIVGK